jgi:hypothetical protein
VGRLGRASNDHGVPPGVDQNGYGLRVPGLVISPYARGGYQSRRTAMGRSRIPSRAWDGSTDGLRAGDISGPTQP